MYIKRPIANADFILVPILVASVGLNWLFVLRPKLPSPTSTRPPLWSVDTVAPAIGINDADGRFVWLEWENRPRPVVLYLFSPRCRWCDRNLAGVQALIRAHGDAFDFIAVGLGRESDRRAILATQLGIRPHMILSGVRSAGYTFGATPHTLVIGKNARVIANWRGAYNPPIQAAIYSILGVRVPLASQ